MSEIYSYPLNNEVDEPQLNVQKFLEEIKGLNLKKTDLKKEINNIDNKINQMYEMIYSICKHEWCIDRTSCGEHTEYYCKKCNLYKD